MGQLSDFGNRQPAAKANEWVWYVEVTGTFDMHGNAVSMVPTTPPPPSHRMAVLIDYFTGDVSVTIRSYDLT